MTHHLAGIDHVLIGVRDLEDARANYRRLGFTLTPRGRHVGWGTANYCAMFPSDYIELIGVVDADGFTNNLDKVLAEREGLMGVALRTHDPDATRQAWQVAGLQPSEVRELGREMETPDGGTTLKFRNVMLPADTVGGINVFACGHDTPEAMRRPEWVLHPNGAVGVASVTVAAQDPGALGPALAGLFGTTSLTETDDTVAVHTGHGLIMVTTPDDVQMIHPQLEPAVEGGRPVLAALTLLSADVEATARYFDDAGVAVRRSASGVVNVDGALANGTTLEFVPAAGFPIRPNPPG